MQTISRKVEKPLLIAALPVRSAKDVERMREVVDIVDLVELRVDYMDDPLALDYEGLRSDKVLITLRDVAEGGAKKHADEVKLKLLNRLDDLGMLYDVEMLFIEKHGNEVNYEGKIVSHHIIDSSHPIDAEGLRGRARKYLDKALIVKVVTVPFPGYKTFLTSLLELGDNVAVMPMSTNPQERIAFTLLGSKILFCCIETPTALGQIRCSDVKAVLDTITKRTSYVLDVK